MTRPAEEDLPAGSPKAITGRFVTRMRSYHGRGADHYMRDFAELLAEVPAHGRIYLDRLLIEELDP